MRRVALALAWLAAGALLAGPAEADVYWAAEGSGKIGHAGGDGTVLPSLASTTAPSAVAIDGSYAYWTQDTVPGAIGRVAIGGGPAEQGFIATGGNSPKGIALDSAGIYWTQTLSGAGAIGRANLSGSGVNPSYLPRPGIPPIGPAGTSPCGVTADGDKTFWANGGSPGSIGRFHGPFDLDEEFLPANDPCGLAEADGSLYWAGTGDGTIRRASLDGTVDAGFTIDTGEAIPCGVAADDRHVYWSATDAEGGWIGRASIDGTSPEPHFIETGVGSEPCGVAVSPTLRVSPLAPAFPATAVGVRSDVQSIVIGNTSSSPLSISGVSIGGGDPGDFEKTGDGCAERSIAVIGSCVVNVVFSPTAIGPRSATLSIASNSTDSPVQVALVGEGTAPPSSAPPVALLDAAPIIERVSVQPRRLAPRSGTTLRFSLSEAAAVTIAIERASSGRTLGALAADGDPGPNAVRFSGRVAGAWLRSGRYRFRLVARDEAGNESAPIGRPFRVLRRLR